MAKSFGDRRREMYGDIAVETQPDERRVTSPQDARIHLRQIYGNDWVNRNWSQIQTMINNPAAGLKAVEGFVQQSATKRQELGVDKLPPKDLTPQETRPQVPSAAAAGEDQPLNLPPELDATMQQLYGTPGSSTASQGMSDMVDAARADGFTEGEIRSLNNMAQSEIETLQHTQGDPDRQAATEDAMSFFNPEYDVASGRKFDHDNQNLRYVDQKDIQEMYNTAGLTPGSPATRDMFSDKLGDIREQMDRQKAQVEQALADPNLDQHTRKQLEATRGDILAAYSDYGTQLMDAVGPGSFMNLPGGLDTPDLTGAEAMAGMQTGGFSQIWNPKSMAKGMMGSLAARALMPTDKAHTGISAADAIQHPGDAWSGFGSGGYYNAPTEEHAMRRAQEQIRAYEIQHGQPMPRDEQMKTMMGYMQSTEKLREAEPERLKNYIQGHTQDIEAERAANTYPQLFMGPQNANLQARLMNAGGELRNLPSNVSRIRQAVPAAYNKGMQAASRGVHAARARPVGTAWNAAKNTVNAAKRAPGAALRGLGAWNRTPLNPMAFGTGLAGAAFTGMDQAAQAASAAGGPNFGTRATGLGATGLTFAGTEAGLAKGMSGAYQALGGVAPQFMRDAARAGGQAFQKGRQIMPVMGGLRGAYNMARSGGMGGLKDIGKTIGQQASRGYQNLKSVIPRAGQAIGAMVSPTARSAAAASRPLASAAKGLSNFGNLRKGLSRGAGGFALGGAAIDGAVNAGDAYSSLAGYFNDDARVLGAIGEGNKDMANQQLDRGWGGTLLNAPSAVTNTRARLGSKQYIDETQRSGKEQTLSGYQGLSTAARQQAANQAAQSAGIDPSVMKDYQYLNQTYGNDPKKMQAMMANNPELQRMQKVKQEAATNYARNRSSSGFSETDASNLAGYMQGGANNSLMNTFFGSVTPDGEDRMQRDTKDLYKMTAGDKNARLALSNLHKAVRARKIDPRAAASLLGVNAANDQAGLLKQLDASQAAYNRQSAPASGNARIGRGSVGRNMAALRKRKQTAANN